MTTGKKLILVIGATGAQGLAVIDALLKPASNGRPSPYAVRALTRDATGRRSGYLAAKGVELVQGSFEDFDVVLEALKGVYGVWANTDGFTVGEKREIYAGMRIFELAKQVGTVRHYIYSNLDYALKKGGYSPDYLVGHYNGKGRVAEWMQAQPTEVGEYGMTWSVVTTGPYMDMLNILMFGPLYQRPDGTFVFASPIGKGHVPMIALDDLGFWARYSFDHRAEVSGRDLEVASQIVGWDELVETFTRVTGQKAEFKPLSVDEWMGLFDGTDRPVARDEPEGSITWRENFSAFWRMWRDDIVQRDMDWIRSVHPAGHTLESWMREKNYSGKLNLKLLKGNEDRSVLGLKKELVSKL